MMSSLPARRPDLFALRINAVALAGRELVAQADDEVIAIVPVHAMGNFKYWINLDIRMNCCGNVIGGHTTRTGLIDWKQSSKPNKITTVQKKTLRSPPSRVV
jgi:hypothetical protein